MGRPGGPGPLDPVFDVAVSSGVIALAASVTPATPLITVTINVAAGQADPAYATPILFDVVFSEAVIGFTGADVTIGGTAGATTAVVSGSGTTYTVAVSGMTTSGTVIASISSGKVFSPATGATNFASTSTDNTVTFLVLTGLAHHWDYSNAATVTMSGPNVTMVDDQIGSIPMVATTPSAFTLGSQNGHDYCVKAPSGTARFDAAIGTPVNQPFGIMLVGQLNIADGAPTFFDTGSTGAQVAFYEFSNSMQMDAGGGLAAVTDSNWHVWFCEFNGASSKLYKDGVLTDTGNAGTNNLNGLRLFNNRFPALADGASIGEVMFATGTQSGATIVGVMNALMTKWGV